MRHNWILSEVCVTVVPLDPTTSLNLYQHLGVSSSFPQGIEWLEFEADHCPLSDAEIGAVPPPS
jgi:hypothetical protein